MKNRLYKFIDSLIWRTESEWSISSGNIVDDPQLFRYQENIITKDIRQQKLQSDRDWRTVYRSNHN